MYIVQYFVSSQWPVFFVNGTLILLCPSRINIFILCFGTDQRLTLTFFFLMYYLENIIQSVLVRNALKCRFLTDVQANSVSAQLTVCSITYFLFVFELIYCNKDFVVFFSHFNIKHVRIEIDFQETKRV